jgi:PleD family two-component response regulator
VAPAAIEKPGSWGIIKRINLVSTILMNSRPRVLLADDHTILLESFKRLLEPACEVVGAVKDGHELLEVAPKLKPQVIVLDIAMPRLNGLTPAGNSGGQILRHG